MHHLDGLFNYQVTYTRELLKELCGQIAVDELDNRLASIPRFPGLKIFKNGLANIKRFTADEFRNMMKVFIFVIEGIIVKHHKTMINENQANQVDAALVNAYYFWNKMYLYGRREYFLKSELDNFEVLYILIVLLYIKYKILTFYYIYRIILLNGPGYSYSSLKNTPRQNFDCQSYIIGVIILLR